MAKGIYVGVESKARKVKKFYIGVDGKARKVKKGYIGVNGVAKLFYSAETLVPFTACPFPKFTDDTATNDYGTWTASSSGRYSTSYKAYLAFDENAETYWRSKALLSNEYAYAQLNFPTGVLINPTALTVKCRQFVRCFVEGYNPESSTWERISEVPVSANDFVDTPFSYTGVEYFSAIRAYGMRYSSGYDTPEVANLKITKGTIKLE